MNMFRLSNCPEQSARMYQDIHVNKIIIEGSQMVANCYSLERLKELDCPRTQRGTPRVYGYFNHPLSKWVRESLGNWEWTIRHIQALLKEKRYRFGPKPHFSEQFIQWSKDNPPPLKPGPETLYPQCFKAFQECISKDPVQGYQKYYKAAKKEFKFGNTVKVATWTKRPVPAFWTD